LKKRMRVRTAGLTTALVVGLACFYGRAANVANGGFESYSYDSSLDANVPAGWQRENYAAVVHNFIPQPVRGSAENWKIDLQQGLTPFEGDSFVVLSNGDIEPDPWSASLRQTVSFAPGEKLCGAYFFGTADWGVMYNDYGTIKLTAESGSGLSDITLVSITVDDVGRYSSTNGWVHFESTVFIPSTAGIYTIEVAVYDVGDTAYDSYLAVDGLIPEPATLFLLSLGAALMRKRTPNPGS
jgi:hypothetical protein